MPEPSDRNMAPRNRSIIGLAGRALRVLISFALAVALALIVLLVLGSLATGSDLRNGYQPDADIAPVVDLLSMVFGGASFIMFVTPTLTILPALVAVIVGEVVEVRSLLYYLVAGGLSMAALPLLSAPVDSRFDPHYLAIFATAGFAGGLAYWLLAGRKA